MRHGQLSKSGSPTVFAPQIRNRTYKTWTIYVGTIVPTSQPESHQRYKELIADKWHPPGFNPKPTISKPSIDVKRKHGDDSNEWKQVRLVLKTIRETYGHLSAADFGPICLENYRQSLIDRELSRGVITRKSNYVITVSYTHLTLPTKA